MSYTSITTLYISFFFFLEQAGWGIAWYVNETLIPELNLKRGVTYTFVVEGGNDPSDLANYHPMYITSSSNGAILRTTEPDEVSGSSPFFFLHRIFYSVLLPLTLYIISLLCRKRWYMLV